MIDLDKIFLNILKTFLIELKFILLYCINRITPGHLNTLPYKKKNIFYSQPPKVQKKCQVKQHQVQKSESIIK